MVLHGQFYRQAGTLVAGLLATYFGMMTHIGIIAIESLGLLHIAVDDGRILAVRHNG